MDDKVIPRFGVVVDVLDALDVPSEFDRCRAALERVVDPEDRVAVALHLEDAARVAHAAYRLHLVARREHERTKDANARTRAWWRTEALRDLEEQKAKGLITKVISDPAVDARARDDHADEWARLSEDDARSEAVRDELLSLHDKLMERSRNLRVLLDARSDPGGYRKASGEASGHPPGGRRYRGGQ